MAHRASSFALAGLVLLGALAVALGQGGNTLAALPYEQIIGGPLNAVVKAQAMAAFETIAFVKQIGFEPPGSGGSTETLLKPRMMEFSYDTVNSDNVEVKGAMTVPLLSCVPIPYLRFESVDVEFNAKITSHVSSHNSASTSSVNSRWGSGIASTTTVSSQKFESGYNYQTSFSLRVSVHCVQAEVPEGMKKILDKLTQLISAQSEPKSGSGSA